MFDAENSPEESEPTPCSEMVDTTSEIRAILSAAEFLPAAVAKAPINRIADRVLLAGELAQLLNPPDGCRGEDWRSRRMNRQKSLTPFIGQRLVCVHIRVPGAGYTLEIDPRNARIAHWEWQAN